MALSFMVFRIGAGVKIPVIESLHGLFELPACFKKGSTQAFLSLCWDVAHKVGERGRGT